MFGAKRNVYFFATFFIPRAFSFFFSVSALVFGASTLFAFCLGLGTKCQSFTTLTSRHFMRIRPPTPPREWKKIPRLVERHLPCLGRPAQIASLSRFLPQGL